jgi:hypothetical protein
MSTLKGRIALSSAAARKFVGNKPAAPAAAAAARTLRRVGEDDVSDTFILLN